MAAEKSLCMTYFLWLFFGWLGAHHFYLRRDRQGFVWSSTVGGFFWVGWIRDFWRIPHYVDEANDEEEYTDHLHRMFKLRKVPPFNTSRFVGELMIGCYYGILVRFAIPDWIPLSVSGFFVCVGITAGVYLVGNIGKEKGPFWMPFVACVSVYVVLSLLAGEEASYTYCSVAASGCFNSYRQHRKEIENESTCIRLTRLSVGFTIIFCLWAGFLAFNATITFENGEQIKLRDSIEHFFRSPAWTDFRGTFWDLFNKQKQEESKEWSKFYDDIIRTFDPTGETHAHNVLGVNSNTNADDVRKAYKKLVVQWHPDRYRGNNKHYAEQKFIEIQQAYELLQKRNRTFRDKTEF